MIDGLIAESMVSSYLKIAKGLDSYLSTTLGSPTRIVEWPGAQKLPGFLKSRYQFVWNELTDPELLYVLDSSPAETSASKLEKHLRVAQEASGLRVAYVREHLSSHSRARLLQRRISFVVPGRQMFLPDVGLDLREQNPASPALREHLAPASQAVLVCILLRDKSDWMAVSDFGPTLGYSAITLSRAAREMEQAGLVESTKIRRRVHIRVIDSRRRAWESAQDLLRSPVKDVVQVQFLPESVPTKRAGLSALAERSDLAGPEQPTVAVGHKVWVGLKNENGIDVIPVPEEGWSLQVWTYAPELLSATSAVDPLSLYLSLRGTADERLEGALQSMMDEFFRER